MTFNPSDFYKIQKALWSTGNILNRKDISEESYIEIKKRGLLFCVECRDPLLVSRRFNGQEVKDYFFKHKPLHDRVNRQCSLYTTPPFLSNTDISLTDRIEKELGTLLTQSGLLQEQWFERGFTDLVEKSKKIHIFNQFEAANPTISKRVVTELCSSANNWARGLNALCLRTTRLVLLVRLLEQNSKLLKKLIYLSFLQISARLKSCNQTMKYIIFSEFLDYQSDERFVNLLQDTRFFGILKETLIRNLEMFSFLAACSLSKEPNMGEIYLLKDTSYSVNAFKIGKTKNINNLIKEYTARRLPGGIVILDSYISDNWRSDELDIRIKFKDLINGYIAINSKTGRFTEWVCIDNPLENDQAVVLFKQATSDI